MKTFNSLDIQLTQPTAVAVGYFDGVHLGHQAVINTALRQKDDGLMTCVFSFDMQSDRPMGKKNAKLISTPTQKIALIKQTGADVLLCPPFSSFMGLSPEQYAVSLLFEKLRAKVVCCGHDYRFGKGACAGADDLKRLLSPLGVKVLLVDAVTDNGLPVSSTRIREALFAGDIATATRLLGHDFSIDFVVSHGKKLGGRLGFPTANQIIAPPFIAPRFGVYATSVTIEGKCHAAVTNVGVNPTVGSDVIVAESYILDFSGDLYGKPITTTFLQFLREEQRFESIEALKNAIAADAAQARKLHQL